MERTLIYKNHKGDMITFTYKPPFLLGVCDGFHEVVGTVNTISSAYGVGTKSSTFVDNEKSRGVKRTRLFCFVISSVKFVLCMSISNSMPDLRTCG